MVGNVWQWTNSLYKPYPYNANDGREDISNTAVRVLRGGAFYFDEDNVRVSNRGGSNPNDFNRGYGFRLVYGVSPIL